MRGAKRRHAAFQLTERIGAGEGFADAVAGNANLVAVGVEPHKRIGAQKAVAPHLLSPHNALEQAAAFPGIEPGKG